MTKTRFKSDASEAIYSTASDLHRAGLINTKTLREYHELCVEPVQQPIYKPDDSSPLDYEAPLRAIDFANPASENVCGFRQHFNRSNLFHSIAYA